MSAFVVCSIGLLKSYSRGAWLGTALGLAALAWQSRAPELQVPSPSSPPRPPRLRATAPFLVLKRWLFQHSSISACQRFSFPSQPSTLNSQPPPSGFPQPPRPPRLRVTHPFSVCQLFSFSAFVLFLSLSLIAFWQFRHTEIHPVRRAFSVANPNDFSWRNRVAAWEGGLAMMADRPLTGFGWAQPERVYDQLYKPARVAEGMAFQLNNYFILGTSLGLPALLCFLAYIATAFQDFPLSACQHFSLSAFSPQPSTFNPFPVCRSASLVLLVGLWFDGGLFHLATAAPLWMLLELGSEHNSPPGHRGTEQTGSQKPPPCGDPEGYT